MVVLYILGSLYVAGSVATFIVSYAIGGHFSGALNASWRWPYMVYAVYFKK